MIQISRGYIRRIAKSTSQVRNVQTEDYAIFLGATYSRRFYRLFYAGIGVDV